MLLVTFLVCSTSFTSNYLNLTNIYIQIKGINTDLYNMIFDSNIKNLTVNTKNIDEKNSCYQISYYVDNNKTQECLNTDIENTSYFDSNNMITTIVDRFKIDNYSNLNTTDLNLTDLNLTDLNISRSSTLGKEYTDKLKEYTDLNNKLQMMNSNNNQIVNTIKSILILNLIIIVGFGLSMIISSIFYRKMKEDFDENIEDYIAYEDKYDIEFEKLEKKL